MKKTLLALSLATVLAACSSTPPATTSSAPAAQETAAAAAPAAAAPAATAPAVTPVLYPPKGEGGALGQRSVFYDFDKYAVRDQYQSVAEAHGEFLVEHPQAKLTLQGNCDERGSREYNLGLGQRRADSVRKVLIAKGAKDGQVETVSFGKEKPRNAGHNEAAWTENRRTDIVYQGE